MAQIALSYSAAQIDAAIAKINSLISVIEGSIVQLYDGTTAIYPRTKAEAVFFDNDPSKDLNTLFSSLISAGFLYKGVATPSTSIITPTERIFYLAGAGTYTNFGSSYVVLDGYLGIFSYDGSVWNFDSIKLVVPVPIVNNLTDGGEESALSAEMGKVLNEDARLPLQPLLSEATVITFERFLSTLNMSYRSYQTAVIGSVWTPTPTSSSDMDCTKFAVKAGDIVSIWGQGSGTTSIYVLVDGEDKVVARGTGGTATTPPQYTRESPVVINIANDGILYVGSKNNVDNGAIIERGVSSSLVITPLVNIIATPHTDIIDVTLDLINYKYQSYQTATIGSIWTPTPQGESGVQCTKVAVKSGDVVSIWGQGNGTASICILVDADNKVVLRGAGGKGTVAKAYTRETPYKINVDADGLLYLNSLESVDNGATIERIVKGYIIANSNNDGVMSKEQASQLQGLIEGGSGLAGKLVATIGDSFSAPNAWQRQMNTILATTSYNVAKSGGRWASTDPTTDAYRQAIKLVTDFINIERKPDYILCVLGVNDVNNSVPLGDIVYSDTIGSGGIDITTFTGGMQAILKTLKDNFTSSIIKVGFTPGGMQYLAASSEIMTRMSTYIERMKEVATLYGIGYIETRATGMCRIVASEYNAYSGGDAHPNAAGQQRIGEYMARILLSNL